MTPFVPTQASFWAELEAGRNDRTGTFMSTQTTPVRARLRHLLDDIKASARALPRHAGAALHTGPGRCGTGPGRGVLRAPWRRGAAAGKAVSRPDPGSARRRLRSRLAGEPAATRRPTGPLRESRPHGRARSRAWMSPWFPMHRNARTIPTENCSFMPTENCTVRARSRAAVSVFGALARAELCVTGSAQRHVDEPAYRSRLAAKAPAMPFRWKRPPTSS